MSNTQPTLAPNPYLTPTLPRCLPCAGMGMKAPAAALDTGDAFSLGSGLLNNKAQDNIGE